MAACRPTVAEQQTWWMMWREMATPLWRYEIAQLDEQQRIESQRTRWVCGHQISQHLAAWQDGVQSDVIAVEDTVQVRLIALDMRHGLSAAAMGTAVSQPNDENDIEDSTSLMWMGNGIHD